MAEFQRKNSPEITKWYQVPDYSKFTEGNYVSSGSKDSDSGSVTHTAPFTGWFIWVATKYVTSYDLKCYIKYKNDNNQEVSVLVGGSRAGNSDRLGASIMIPVAKDDKVYMTSTKGVMLKKSNCRMGFYRIKFLDA